MYVPHSFLWTILDTSQMESQKSTFTLHHTTTWNRAVRYSVEHLGISDLGYKKSMLNEGSVPELSPSAWDCMHVLQVIAESYSTEEDFNLSCHYLREYVPRKFGVSSVVLVPRDLKGDWMIKLGIFKLEWCIRGIRCTLCAWRSRVDPTWWTKNKARRRKRED